jgi:hypothetical protein
MLRFTWSFCSREISGLDDERQQQRYRDEE